MGRRYLRLRRTGLGAAKSRLDARCPASNRLGKDLTQLSLADYWALARLAPDGRRFLGTDGGGTDVFDVIAAGKSGRAVVCEMSSA